MPIDVAEIGTTVGKQPSRVPCRLLLRDFVFESVASSAAGNLEIFLGQSLQVVPKDAARCSSAWFPARMLVIVHS